MVGVHRLLRTGFRTYIVFTSTAPLTVATSLFVMPMLGISIGSETFDSGQTEALRPSIAVRHECDITPIDWIYGPGAGTGK